MTAFWVLEGTTGSWGTMAPGQQGNRGGQLVAGVVGMRQGLGTIMWDHKGTLWGPGGH